MNSVCLTPSAALVGSRPSSSVSSLNPRRGLLRCFALPFEPETRERSLGPASEYTCGTSIIYDRAHGITG